MSWPSPGPSLARGIGGPTPSCETVRNSWSLTALGWSPGAAGVAADTTEQAGMCLLEWLTPGEPADLDWLVHRTGRPAADILSVLMRLELTGLVRRAPGGGFLRTGRQVV